MGRYTLPLHIRMLIEGWTRRLLFFQHDENSKVGDGACSPLFYGASSPMLFKLAKINRVEKESNKLIICYFFKILYTSK